MLLVALLDCSALVAYLDLLLACVVLIDLASYKD